MTLRQTLEDDHSPTASVTTSGGRIETIGVGAALTFLVRLRAPGGTLGTPDHAWGAFEDAGVLIGVAVLAMAGSSSGHACVAVVPDRRRRRVGSDLLHHLVEEAGARGLKTVTYDYPAADPVPQRLIHSLPLIAARRVQDQTATLVAILPDPTRRDQSGDQ